MKKNAQGMFILEGRTKKEKPKNSPCVDGCGFLNRGSYPRRCSECSLKRMEQQQAKHKKKQK